MTEKNLEGLGGWLILVGIAIVLAPIRTIFQMAPLYWNILTSGTWSLVTDATSASYHPLWAPIFVSEVALNLALVAAEIFAIYSYFSKRRIFPSLYMGIIVFSMVFIVADAMFVSFVQPNEPIFDPDTLREFTRSVIAAVIWIPYMLVSKRVKATFVN